MTIVAKKGQAGELWEMTWPAMLRNYLACGSTVACLAFVGWWDSRNVAHYDGAGIGKMYSNITGLSIGFGLSMGLATFAAQAHGAGRSHLENGMHLRRCSAILSCAFLCTAALSFFAEPILLAMGQPPEVAAASALFAQVQLIGLPAAWMGTAIQTVLDGILRTIPGFYGCVVSTVAQIVSCVVLMHPKLMGIGYLGMAISTVIGNYSHLLVMMGYVWWEQLFKQVWCTSLSEEQSITCPGLFNFLIVTLPSAAMMWMEWWAFEGLTVLVGLLPNAKTNLAAHSTLFNTVIVFYMSYTGLSTAVCSLVGRNVGASDAAANKRLVVLSMGLCCLMSSVVSSFLWFFRWEIAAFFTPGNQSIIAAVEQGMLGICLSIPSYGALMTLYGVCRGANLQSTAVYGTTIGYAVIGFPVAWFLGDHLGWPNPLLGIWLGNVSALTFAAGWVLVLVLMVDWSNLGSVSSSSDASEEGSGGATDNESQLRAPLLHHLGSSAFDLEEVRCDDGESAC